MIFNIWCRQKVLATYPIPYLLGFRHSPKGFLIDKETRLPYACMELT
jgi:hypothetical protein